MGMFKFGVPLSKLLPNTDKCIVFYYNAKTVKIKVIEIGKTEERYLKEGISEYMNRLTHYISMETVTLPASKSRTPEAVKLEEEKLILQKLTAGDHVILLDEKGEEFSSAGFSSFLQKKMNSGMKNLVFVIGG